MPDIFDQITSGQGVAPQGDIFDAVAEKVSFQNGTGREEQIARANSFLRQGEEAKQSANQWGMFGRMLEPWTTRGMLNQGNRALGYADMDTSKPLINLQGISDTPLQMIEQGLNLPQGALTGENSPIAGLAHGAENIGSGFTSMENLATLPAFGAKAVTPIEEGLKRLMLTILGGEQAVGLPGQIQQAEQVQVDPRASTADKYAAALNPAASAGMAMTMLEHGLKPKVEVPSGVKPGDVSAKLTASDSDYIAGRQPPERQLNGPRGQFVVDPSGRAVDMSQLSPS